MAVEHPTGVESRAHEIIVTIIVCTVLSTAFVTVRLLTRLIINRAVGWDDYVALATVPFVITYGVLLGINTRYGMGLHQKDMPEGLEVEYYRWINIGSPFWLMSLLGYKMSILLLYLRIYQVNKPFRYATYVTMFIVFGYLFSNFWTQLFGCHPFKKEYDKKTPGHCIDYIKADYAYGSLNCITDMIIFILPLPMIWKLQLNIKEKIGISLIFMIGSLNWAVAIVRFVLVVKDLTAPDRTWLAAETFLWSVIEVNTGLICSCLPVLKPFFRRVVPQSLSDKSWSLGRGKISWTGDTLNGDGDTETLNHKEWLDMGRGGPIPVKADFNNGSIGSAATRSDSDGTIAPPVPHKNIDLENAKYGSDLAYI